MKAIGIEKEIENLFASSGFYRYPEKEFMAFERVVKWNERGLYLESEGAPVEFRDIRIRELP